MKCEECCKAEAVCRMDPLPAKSADNDGNVLWDDHDYPHDHQHMCGACASKRLIDIAEKMVKAEFPFETRPVEGS